jgi:hypothetical protein
MKSFFRTVSGIFVAFVATGLGAVAIAADAGKPPASPAGAATPADMAQRHQAMIQHHLDAAAARLEIKASQQSAWQAYAAAVKDLAAEGMPPRPDADADAATIARQRAERASAFARKLGVIADATAKLQAVLTPEQKSVLTELTRNAGMHRPMMGGKMHGMHGGMRDPMGHDHMGQGPMGPGPADHGEHDAPARGN